MERETKRVLPKLVDTLKKSSIIIPLEVNKKIKYLCTNIPNNEWSGVLIYKRTGDLDNIPELSFTAVDIFLMDKGTSAATDYEFGIELIKLYDIHPEYMEDHYIGHIHSHQTFSVFFSGTDNEELQENVTNHNGYLSLIVNNKNEMTCKFAIEAKQKVKREFSFKTFIGNILSGNPEEIEETICATINVNVVKEDVEDNIEQFFIDRYKEINSKNKFNNSTSIISGNRWNERTGWERSDLDIDDDYKTIPISTRTQVPVVTAEDDSGVIKFIQNCLTYESYQYATNKLGLDDLIKSANEQIKMEIATKAITKEYYASELLSFVVDAIEDLFSNGSSSYINLDLSYQKDKIKDYIKKSQKYLLPYMNYTCIKPLLKIFNSIIDSDCEILKKYYTYEGTNTKV